MRQRHQVEQRCGGPQPGPRHLREKYRFRPNRLLGDNRGRLDCFRFHVCTEDYTNAAPCLVFVAAGLQLGKSITSFAKLEAQDLSRLPVVIVLRSILRVSVGSVALLSPSPESAKETLP